MFKNAVDQLLECHLFISWVQFSSVGRAGASQLQSSDTLIYITRAAKYNMLLRKSKANISFFQSLDPQLISVAGLL